MIHRFVIVETLSTFLTNSHVSMDLFPRYTKLKLEYGILIASSKAGRGPLHQTYNLRNSIIQVAKGHGDSKCLLSLAWEVRHGKRA